MSTDEHVLRHHQKVPLASREATSVFVPRLEFLDDTWLAAVCDLEPQCYPNPWSSTLIQGEFSKEISLRLGLVHEEQLLAYSFSHSFCDQLHILNFAVAPSWRGRGLATILMSHLLRYAVREKLLVALLEVRPSNHSALQLYARFGFKRVGIRRSYYRDNGEDAILLERQLSPSDISDFEWLSFAAIERFRTSLSITSR